MTAMISSPFCSRSFRSEPNILTASSPFTPLTASSMLSAIGWENPQVTPGIFSTSSSMASISSSLRPRNWGRHSPRGLRSTKYSVLKNPVASVPSSERPTCETTFVTSGKLAKMRRALSITSPPADGPVLGDRARLIFASFPEVTKVVSQVGRSDDGTDATGFFNTEYFVDLKPRGEWRPQFRGRKELLIEAMDDEVEKIPGVTWGFSQPIADNMEEAVSGVKGELAVKIFGSDLKDLEQKGEEIMAVMKTVPGVADLGLFRVLGQPNVNIVVNREKADRFGINASDIQDAIQTAVGGNPVSQILIGEQRFDLVPRYQERFRQSVDDIRNIRIAAPSGERVSLGEVTDIKIEDGASMINREGNQRYIAIKYSVRGSDLGSTVEQAMTKVNREIKLPQGYTLEWAGEYESQKRANRRLAIVIPLTILVIMLVLYSMFRSFKWGFLVLLNLGLAPLGGLIALLLTGEHFSVSTGVGFLALFGVSVQTGVVMIEYINQLRARGLSVQEAVIVGSTRRLRPIMMTMLVASLGLLPAAMSHDIGSDSQRPFAIVIVGGLLTELFLSLVLLPAFYAWMAGPNDVLPEEAEEVTE